ncbi:MAG: glycoside hydrolase family 2 TIM barrel-domain containing protein [Eubacteriales bacterium]
MKKICISKGWSLNAPGTNGWKSVDLPNDYSVTQPRDPNAPGGGSNGFFRGGVGTYVKELELGGGHYILDVDGAYMCTTVELNEFRLVMHPHGYTPFLVDLTKRKKEGKNKLVITTNGLQPSTRWYSGAGIYRDVFLWEGGDIRLEPWDVFVTTPTLDTVHASFEVSSDRDAEVTLTSSVIDADGKKVASAETKLSLKAGEKTHAELGFKIENAHLWDTVNPYLYSLHTEICENGAAVENDDTTFGIRTISADAKNGLLLNGNPIKLRGGCIHHDHGVLGAADYPAACRRKVEKLKETGFNALRIAHNPPSTQLMEICDELGIIVMNEAFDCWRTSKGGELNYHVWFDDWWERDIASMVRRDRAHPCVIAYSIGNEIPESYGNTDGDEWSKRLADEIRKHDSTRLVTSATWEMGGGETWAERTKGYYAPLDICGYNYIYRRYESDHELFPDRVIWGSETHAIHFYDSWHSVLRNSYVIGDFTWTAYDNLGEVGTGRSCWARDGHISGISLAEYPWRTCYQGDLDLCGYRRPQSYFREAVWIGNTEPKIFTTHPEHYGEGFSGTGWHWYDVLDSWNFDDKYLGKPVKCEVYTDADEIEWYLNGTLLGRSKPEKAIASFDINYERGEVSVIAYKNGVKCGSSSLHTVGKPYSVKVEAEKDSLCADNRDLCYFDITVTDENGDRIPDSKAELCCIVDGGELLGIFSGDPKNEDCYGSNICHAFEGRAVAIVRTSHPGKVTVTVGSKGLYSGKAIAAAE